MLPDKNNSYTYSDYLTWNDDSKYELINGSMYFMSPAPSPYHQEISKNLIIEILSPSIAIKDLNIKFKLYEQQGVAEYWILSPAEKELSQFVIIQDRYELQKVYEKDEVITSKVISNLSVPLKNIF